MFLPAETGINLQALHVPIRRNPLFYLNILVMTLFDSVLQAKF